MKVLISNTANAYPLNIMLKKYGVDTTLIPRTKPFIGGDYDIFLVFGVRPKNVLYALTGPGEKIYRFQGSNGFKPRLFSPMIIKAIMSMAPGNIMYASQGLKDYVGLPGTVLINPINTDLFKPIPGVVRDLDVLYYCPHGRDQIYMKERCPPGATVLDGSTSYEVMPLVYSAHRKYVRWTTHDANPKMPYEALLCGCEVWVNGEQITEVPDAFLMEKTIPRWIEYMEELVK